MSLQKENPAEYTRIHKWAKNTLGTPSICWRCGHTKGRNFEWANISGKYKKDERDWLRLCKQCHAMFDQREHGRHTISKEFNNTNLPPYLIVIRNQLIIQSFDEGMTKSAIALLFNLTKGRITQIIGNEIRYKEMIRTKQGKKEGRPM